MHLIVLFLMLSYVQAQLDSCLCSCCSGLSCYPVLLPPIDLQDCTLERCLHLCRATYSQCQSTQPFGQLIAQCNSTTRPMYNCQCNCCNTGFPTCSPSFIGNSQAYQCETAACSISCTKQYPTVCVADQNGQTQGLCTGLIETTSTTTTTAISPWLVNTCSCFCCLTASNCLPKYVGITSASQCSSLACTQACRNQYPSLCPSFSQPGQTSGICSSENTGDTICNCRCCSTNGCSSYGIITSGGCAACNAQCQQKSPCTKPDQVQYTCYTNSGNLFLSWVMLINFSILFIIN